MFNAANEGNEMELKRGDKCETRFERAEKCVITGFVNVPKYDKSGSERWARVRFTDGARLLVHPTGLVKKRHADIEERRT